MVCMGSIGMVVIGSLTVAEWGVIIGLPAFTIYTISLYMVGYCNGRNSHDE